MYIYKVPAKHFPMYNKKQYMREKKQNFLNFADRIRQPLTFQKEIIFISRVSAIFSHSSAHEADPCERFEWETRGKVTTCKT
jgi:hypothetical protein